MTNWLKLIFGDREDAYKLAIAAASASILTASTILTYQAIRRHNVTRSLNPPEKHSVAPVDLVAATQIDIDEQLARTTAFVGKEGLDRLRHSFVIVVGAGGVGSWAALMLLRAGVQRIRIIDFDQVTLSSLNRHAVATLDDVGTPKVKAIRKHFKRIAPFVDVEARIDLFSAETADELLSGSPDYVIDAIDNIDTKLYLIKYCCERKLPVISSMGAGAKADPSRIQVADISETFEDQLARAVRRKLKKMGVERGVPVVYSAEKPHHVKLLPLEEERVAEADEFAALPDFRSRILPVLGTIPSMFGMALASYIIVQLAKYPNFEPMAIKLREGVYVRTHRDLMARENKHYKNKICQLDQREVAYVYEELWLGKSVISKQTDRLALTRWDRSKPLSLTNTVCMTKEEADAHDKLPSDVDLRDHYGQDIFDFVSRRLDQERKYREQWRNVF